jgi:hypothetical protein
MQTLTLEVTNQAALKTLYNLEEKQFIRILEDTDRDSPALPGKSFTLQNFKNWISAAEASTSVSLKKAKQKWSGTKNPDSEAYFLKI